MQMISSGFKYRDKTITRCGNNFHVTTNVSKCMQITGVERYSEFSRIDCYEIACRFPLAIYRTNFLFVLFQLINVTLRKVVTNAKFGKTINIGVVSYHL